MCVRRKSQELAQWLSQSLGCAKSFKDPVLCVPPLKQFPAGRGGDEVHPSVLIKQIT